MGQNQKAKSVFEQYSKPLKTCWKLEEIEDFDVIYYAPDVESLCCAKELAKQISNRHKHDVKLIGIYPNKKNLDEICISYNFIKELSQPRCLVVCDEYFEEKIIKTIKVLGCSIAPKIFCVDNFCVKIISENDVIKQLAHCNIASKMTMHQVSYIVVLASAREVWNYAVQLYRLHKQIYRNEMVKLVLCADETDTNYNISACYGFLQFCKEYINDVKICWNIKEFTSELWKDKILWVLPRHKSYMTDVYYQSFFYVENETFEDLLLTSSVIGKSCLLKDVYELALVGCKSKETSAIAKDFLETYQQKNYPSWIMNCYYFIRRIKMFGIGSLFCF